jgi:16S rRNA C967 or C1407 C5-methylase (RsmB/RsmF family)
MKQKKKHRKPASSRAKPSSSAKARSSSQGRANSPRPGRGKQPKKSAAKPTADSGYKPRPLNFRLAFDALWTKLFTTPVHLDSALSQSPPSVKSTLAPLSRLLLQRPRSLAYYLRFHLSDDEPWWLDQEVLADWSTARAMASRLFQAWERDPHFFAEGRPREEDFPPWMVEEWKRDFGPKASDELVQALGTPPPMSLRASRSLGRDSVASELNDSGELEIRGKISKITPFGITFPDYAPVLSHPLFKKGAFEIQDEGSQLMALFALWPETFLPMLRKIPGSCREWPKDKEVPKGSGQLTVVDTCAGAGGKTLALADALLGRGQVFAYDVSAKKLESLRKRAQRAGLHNTKTVPLIEGKEETIVNKFRGTADVVLVDAPCSGWGVLRRNPDLKWRQAPGSLERLEELQARLLDAYCGLVKPGGTLTYGVCTFRKPETTGQVENFLERHPEFTSVGGGYFGPGPSDGFFFHAFRRNLEKKSP